MSIELSDQHIGIGGRIQPAIAGEWFHRTLVYCLILRQVKTSGVLYRRCPAAVLGPIKAKTGDTGRIRAVGLQTAGKIVMIAYNSNLEKTPTATSQNAAAVVTVKSESESPRYVSPSVAHELNNIFTVIQGYADRLFLKHSNDPALQSHLKLIGEASRRAANVVREATPRDLPLK
jgi:signal transduction histidine kinase